MYYEYTIGPDSKTPILQLNKHIGYDADVTDEEGNVISKGEGYGIFGLQFAKELFELDRLSPDLITIFHNSMGGDVKEAYDILNALINLKSKTKSVIAGFCFSSDGWLALVADTVHMYDYATWMCHLPFYPEDEKKTSPFLASVAKSVAKIIASKSGKNGKTPLTEQQVMEMMKTKTYLTAQEMYEKGLIDKVINTDNKIVRYSAESNQVKNYYSEYQKVVNKFTQTSNTHNMSFVVSEKVLNRLKLAPNSPEEAVLAAIANYENEIAQNKVDKETLIAKLSASNEEQAELQKRLAELTSKNNQYEADMKIKEEAVNKSKEDLKNLTEKVTALQAEKDAAENKAKEEALVVAKEKAKNLVKPYFDAGKIKESAVPVWEQMAVENFERTQVQLEALPTNFTAPRAVNVGGKTIKTEATPGTLEWYRANNAAKHEKAELEREQKIKENQK